jgi:divalent metal cation (Fe/Co/Zn/Cd) transporter
VRAPTRVDTIAVRTDADQARLLQRITIAWNLGEVFVTVGLGLAAGSLALIAFGFDSLVEVFASFVVLRHLDGGDGEGLEGRERRATRLVGGAFAVLALYLAAASIRALVVGAEPDSSPLGIAYLAVTAVVMFGLATTKRRVGLRLGSRAVLAEARMTLLDGCLATGILVALVLNTTAGWWWADPLAALAVALVAAREAVESRR